MSGKSKVYFWVGYVAESGGHTPIIEPSEQPPGLEDDGEVFATWAEAKAAAIETAVDQRDRAQEILRDVRKLTRKSVLQAWEKCGRP